MTSCLRTSIATLAIAIAGLAAVPAHAQQKLPDSTLFTQYSTFYSMINWTTCGRLPLTYGCYGAGQLGPFTNACSIVQSVPAPINLNTVVRYIYVLDSGASPGGVLLTVYKRTDQIMNQSTDTITVAPVATVPLPQLTGGAGVTCMTAQNQTNVFAATSQSNQSVSINKLTYAVRTGQGYAGTVTSITADSYGFVSVDVFANGGYASNVYGPDGGLIQDGGGDYFMINPINGMTPSNFPQ